MKIKLLLPIFLAFIFFGFIYVGKIQAVTSSAVNNFSHEVLGTSGTTVRAALLSDYNNFQAWQVSISGHVEGHGAAGPSGGKYGIDMCLSPNGAMWAGPDCWNVVDANTGGNIGDGSGDFNHTRNIGNNATADYSYGVVSFYVNDATADPVNLTVYGRQVSISGPNASFGTIAVGGQTDITWTTNEVSNSVVFSYSGPVTCDIGASPQTVSSNAFVGTTCTATGPGTATFTVEATGYNGRNGSRPKTISASTNVTITNPGSDITFNVTDACSGGNIAGNATITLTGVGTQVTTNAGAYNTTTFYAAASGIRTYTSVVPGYTNTPGTVNVNSSKTVSFAQARTCGGPWSTFTASSPFGYTNSSGPITVGYGTDSTTLTWTSNAGNCTVTSSPNVGSWSGANGTNVNVGALTANTTFTLTCDNGAPVRNMVVNIPPVVTNLNLSCPTPGTTATATWTAPAGYGTFYFRALNGTVIDLGPTFYIPNSNESQTGTTGTVVTTPGNAYTVYVYSRATNGAWSNFSGANVTCVSNPSTVTNVTISSPNVSANGTSQYTITVTANESTGGANIYTAYALVNLQGADAGSFRGFPTWGIADYWPSDQNRMQCTNLQTGTTVDGGWAVIQSTGGNNGYGHEYINLVSCSTSVSSNTRTTNFVVTFNPLFQTNGPLTNNDISGYASNSTWTPASWTNFPDLFSLTGSSAPTASLRANGSSNLSVAVGDTVNYLWSSTNGVSWLTSLQIYNITTGLPVANDGPGCGSNSTANFAAISGASGALNGNIVAACQSGYRYELVYTVTNSSGTAVQSTLNVSVPINPVNGVCGSRAGGPDLSTRTYPAGVTDWSGDTYCTIGNPSSSPAFPAVGDSVTWQCLGQNSGADILCTTIHDEIFSVNVVVNTTAGGTVTSMPVGINCGGTCSTSFPENSLVTLIATPSSSYWRFSGWSGDCSGTGACLLTIDGPKNVMATFVPRTFRYIEF